MRIIFVLFILLFTVCAQAEWFDTLQAPADVDKTSPTNGQVLAWDSTYLLWRPTTINTASVSNIPYDSSWGEVIDVAPSKKVVYDKIQSLVLGAGTGDVIGPATNHDLYVPQWDGANSKTLKDGINITAVTSEKIQFTIDGHGKTIETNASGHKVIPYACTITSYELTSTVSGSIVVDIKKSTFGTYPTFASIAASAKPTLSSAQTATDSTLTGWTKTISSGDRIQAVVDSSDIVGTVVLTLYVTKT